MTDSNLQDRVDSLEVQLMHLEAALDEVTSTLLKQETQLNLQAGTIRRLESLIKNQTGGGSANTGQEPPPPHY